MGADTSTCWGLVTAAASGSVEARERFASIYEPVIRSYLGARWRGQMLIGSLDDGTQDVFWELFRKGGALERLDAERGSEFRAYLMGVIRNVANRYEQKAWKESLDRIDPAIEAEDTSIATAFDRAWAQSVLKEAARIQERNAEKKGVQAIRRVELLKLRVHEGVPIREIALRWEQSTDLLHREYAKARQEFLLALREAVAFQRSNATDLEITSACREILQLIQKK